MFPSTLNAPVPTSVSVAPAPAVPFAYVGVPARTATVAQFTASVDPPPIEPAVRQAPAIEKHPAEIFRPLENVVVPEFVKAFNPEKVLLFASRVDDAAVIVIEPPTEREVLLIVPRVPVRKLVPIEVVATIDPFALVERSLLTRVVIAKVEEVAFTIVRGPVKLLVPENVLLSERSVVEAELPPPPVMHAPFTAKQPVDRLKPFAAVDVALPVRLSARAFNPPVNVDEADELLLVNTPTNVDEADTTIPCADPFTSAGFMKLSVRFTCCQGTVVAANTIKGIAKI